MTKERERIAKAFNARLEIYRDKRRRSPRFAEESYTRYEALAYVIDAIELLAVESGLGDLVQHEEPTL